MKSKLLYLIAVCSLLGANTADTPVYFGNSALRLSKDGGASGADLMTGMRFRNGYFGSSYEAGLILDKNYAGPSVQIMTHFYPMKNYGFYIGSGVGLAVFYSPQMGICPYQYTPLRAGYEFKSGHTTQVQYDHTAKSVSVSYGYSF